MAPAILIFSAILLLDQATKYLAQTRLASVTTQPVVPGVFHLTLVHNQGAAFGMLQGGVFLFALVSVVCILAIIVMLKKPRLLERVLGIPASTTAVPWLLGMIMGGAVGNLMDRLRLGYVIDFLDLRVWPVFNIADTAITLGGACLFLILFQHDRKKATP